MLKKGNLAAHTRCRLPLLPSGPDGIYGGVLHKTQFSTHSGEHFFANSDPHSGFLPCCSGLQVTRHRWLPA